MTMDTKLLTEEDYSNVIVSPLEPGKTSTVYEMSTTGVQRIDSKW